jgi:metallo-beta-lactamase family protein
MKIKTLGAAGGVTGSAFLLGRSNYELLVDFGMYQGGYEIESWNMVRPDMEIKHLKAVLLTHAHLDHCGRLPMLYRWGYKGEIYMTKPTMDLVEIVLLDAAKIAKEDDRAVLYNEDDVLLTMSRIKIVEYDKEFAIDDWKIKYRDAGHILGSAFVEIEDKQSSKKVVFSGDLGNSPDRFLAETDEMTDAEVVVMESTYGDRLHADTDPVEELRLIIAEAIAKNAEVLIPSFSIQRSQELLYILNSLKNDKVIPADLPIILDSPMAVRATDVFTAYPQYFNDVARREAKSDLLFDFPGMVRAESVQMSRAANELMPPKVIIAGSGMMTGGRVIRHAVRVLPHKDNQIVFVGYQAVNTLGRKILEGAPRVKIREDEVEVRARVKEVHAMSAHADQRQLLDWLSGNKRLKRVVLVHGEEGPRLELSRLIKEMNPGVAVHLPFNNQEINCD